MHLDWSVQGIGPHPEAEPEDKPAPAPRKWIFVDDQYKSCAHSWQRANETPQGEQSRKRVAPWYQAGFKTRSPPARLTGFVSLGSKVGCEPHMRHQNKGIFNHNY